jgi:hypothetical protein
MPNRSRGFQGALETLAPGLALVLLASATGVAAPKESRSPSADVARAAPPETADLPPRSLRITLYAYDVHELLDPVFEVVAAETSAIFEDMGVEVSWKRAGFGTTYGGGAAREIPIIVLKEPPGGHRSKSNLLGLVPKDRPSAVWVFVANVRSALGLSAGDVQASSMRRLAVAVGRVIAHEVVHTLAPQLPHTRIGLMRDSLDVRDLTGSYRPTYEPCRAVVRAALEPAAPRPARAPAAAQPFSPRY